MLFPPWLLRAGSGAAFAASSLTPCLLSWLLAGPLRHVGPVAAVLLALGLAAVQLSSSRKVPSSRSCSLAPAWVVCVPVGLKRPKRTWGEKNLWVVTAGYWKGFSRVPSISVAMAKDLLEPRYSFECQALQERPWRVISASSLLYIWFLPFSFFFWRDSTRTGVTVSLKGNLLQ